MFAITPPGGLEWIVIGLIFVLLFGAKKLPELGGSVGKSIRNFKKSIDDSRDGDEASATDESTTPESTTPESTTPESTTPESTTPESTDPEPTTRESTSHDAAPAERSSSGSTTEP